MKLLSWILVTAVLQALIWLGPDGTTLQSLTSPLVMVLWVALGVLQAVILGKRSWALIPWALTTILAQWMLLVSFAFSAWMYPSAGVTVFVLGSLAAGGAQAPLQREKWKAWLAASALPHVSVYVLFRVCRGFEQMGLPWNAHAILFATIDGLVTSVATGMVLFPLPTPVRPAPQLSR